MTERRSVPHAATLRPDRRCCGLALLLAFAVAAPATAQYRAAGSDLEVVTNTKEQLEKSLAEAQWHLGHFRLAPWIGLRDVSYVRELDAQGQQQEGDLTVTAGAGLKGYLPLGRNAILAAHALPEYAWWRRQSERNAAVGRYGLGLFGWFNRLQGEITGRSVETVEFLSSDLLVREPTRDDRLEVKAQVRAIGAIAVFAAADDSRVRVDSTADLTVDPALLLDRDTLTLRGGLRYLLRGDRGYVGAGALRERTDFEAADGVRSNDGSSWYAEAFLRGNHLDVTALYDQRELEPADSAFPGYSAPNGNVAVLVHPGWRMQYQLYALRQLRYSARELLAYFEEQRAGVGVKTALGQADLQLYYESGDDEYFGNTQRHESVTAYGGWLDLALFRKLKLRVGGRQARFEPDGGTVREVNEATGALSLTLGQPGEW